MRSVKGLVVTISSDLSWNKYVGITIKKANKALEIIKRTVGTADQDIFRYCTLVQVTVKTYSGVRGSSVELMPRKKHSR